MHVPAILLSSKVILKHLQFENSHLGVLVVLHAEGLVAHSDVSEIQHHTQGLSGQ